MHNFFKYTSLKASPLILSPLISSYQATGSPPPMMSWWKDGEKVHEGAIYAVSGAAPGDDGQWI